MPYYQWYVLFKSAVLIFPNDVKIMMQDVTDDALDVMGDICAALRSVPFFDQHVATFGAEYWCLATSFRHWSRPSAVGVHSQDVQLRREQSEGGQRTSG